MTFLYCVYIGTCMTQTLYILGKYVKKNDQCFGHLKVKARRVRTYIFVCFVVTYICIYANMYVAIYVCTIVLICLYNVNE